MGVPKRKTSKSRRDKRRVNLKEVAVKTIKCKKCNSDTIPHRLCVSCKTYAK